MVTKGRSGMSLRSFTTALKLAIDGFNIGQPIFEPSSSSLRATTDFFRQSAEKFSVQSFGNPMLLLICWAVIECHSRKLSHSAFFYSWIVVFIIIARLRRFLMHFKICKDSKPANCNCHNLLVSSLLSNVTFF